MPRKRKESGGGASGAAGGGAVKKREQPGGGFSGEVEVDLEEDLGDLEGLPPRPVSPSPDKLKATWDEGDLHPPTDGRPVGLYEMLDNPDIVVPKDVNDRLLKLQGEIETAGIEGSVLKSYTVSQLKELCGILRLEPVGSKQKLQDMIGKHLIEWMGAPVPSAQAIPVQTGRMKYKSPRRKIRKRRRQTKAQPRRRRQSRAQTRRRKSRAQTRRRQTRRR